jgi:hypothetical protein
LPQEFVCGRPQVKHVQATYRQLDGTVERGQFARGSELDVFPPAGIDCVPQFLHDHGSSTWAVQQRFTVI